MVNRERVLTVSSLRSAAGKSALSFFLSCRRPPYDADSGSSSALGAPPICSRPKSGADHFFSRTHDQLFCTGTDLRAPGSCTRIRIQARLSHAGIRRSPSDSFAATKGGIFKDFDERR